MKTPNLPELQANHRAAFNALRKGLEKAYPLSSVWLVRIKDGQKHPCSMKVIGHEPGWRTCIRFEKPGKPKRFGYDQPKPCRRSVTLDNIVS